MGNAYRNKRKYNIYRDDYKKKTGVKKTVQLKGNEDEIKVSKQLSKFFEITFSKEGTFKTTDYVICFLKPGDEFKDYYNLYNEVLLLFSPYSKFQSRSLDFVDKTLEEYDNRLDKVCVFLVSNDLDIETKINQHCSANKDSRIIIPFTYTEILNQGISKRDISKKLQRYFYNRDLFALESPLKTEAYFYGRSKLIQKLYDKYLIGEQSGLFGLRKTGKTSVLYALERQMILRKGHSIYIDCQNPGIYNYRWNELLFFIINEINNKYNLDIHTDIGNYDDKNAPHSFERDIKTIYSKINNRVLLMFDEIEHICFKTSDSEHWKNGTDYCRFWQTIRSVIQKEPHCFSFLVAGVNPLCIEEAYIQDVENPIFSMISIEYLDLFTLTNVKDMIGSIGKYMGLSFDEEIYTKLTEDYGGHPFLIRHICSLINADMSTERPINVSKYDYENNKGYYDSKIIHYVEMILGVLKNWYPEEFDLLEILAIDGNEVLKSNILYREKEIQHLIGYGIIKEHNTNYYITIKAVENYLEKSHKLKGKLTDKEQKWGDISIRRNNLESKLRKLALLTVTTQYGSKKVKDKMLEIIDSSRIDREKLRDVDVKELIDNHYYLLDVKKVIIKNWSLFEHIFIDKTKFDNFIDVINKYRVDAHAKTVDDSEMLMLKIAFDWFDQSLKDLPL